MNKDEHNKRNEIKKLLAKYLGIENSDIHEDDLLREDLHMGPMDLTDFSQLLSEHEFEVKHSDWAEIESVDDIYDYLN